MHLMYPPDELGACLQQQQRLRATEESGSMYEFNEIVLDTAFDGGWKLLANKVVAIYLDAGQMANPIAVKYARMLQSAALDDDVSLPLLIYDSKAAQPFRLLGDSTTLC